MIENIDLLKIRNEMAKSLEAYKGKPVRFDINPKIMGQIVFEYVEDENCVISKTFAFTTDIAKKIDYTGLSFDDFDASFVNFSDFVGVSLNPQTVRCKDLYGSILKGVHFNNTNFFQVDVREADFSGSIGAVIDPQIVRDRDISCTDLCDATVYDDFTTVNVVGIKIEGAHIIKTPQKEVFSTDKCIEKIKKAIKIQH